MNEDSIDSLLDNLLKKTDYDLSNSNNGSGNDRHSNILKKFSDLFEYSISYLNSHLKDNILDLFHLPTGLLSILFNVEKASSGFIIYFRNNRAVLVLFEDNNFVSFIGRDLENKGTNKAIKLLRLSYKKDDFNEYEFMDNTNMKIGINEVVYQIINWGIN